MDEWKTVSCLSQNQSIVKVWRSAWLLCVHSDELESFPERLHHVVQIKFHVATNHYRVWLARQAVHLLDGDLIDLVVDIQTGQIHTVGGDHVDELVLGAVFAEEHLGVEDLEGVQDGLDHFLVAARKGTGGIEAQAAALLLLEVDVGLALVQTNAHALQLSLEQLPVNVGLGGVQHHQHQISGAGYGNDLTTTPLALGSALDDSGQIQQLDIGTLILNDARNAGQSGELIVCCRNETVKLKCETLLGGVWHALTRLRFRFGQSGQHCGLAHGGKANEGHPGVAALEHIKSVALFALLGWLQQLGAILGQLGLQQAQMVFGGYGRGMKNMQI